MGEKIGNIEGIANGEDAGIELHRLHNSTKDIPEKLPSLLTSSRGPRAF